MCLQPVRTWRCSLSRAADDGRSPAPPHPQSHLVAGTSASNTAQAYARALELRPVVPNLGEEICTCAKIQSTFEFRQKIFKTQFLRFTTPCANYTERLAERETLLHRLGSKLNRIA